MVGCQTDIAVIIVGFNSREYLHGCLASLRDAEWTGYSHKIVYVDNASSDGSPEMVRAQFPEVIVIDNLQNLGFCAACNQGVACTDSRYVYLLNIDTVLFPDSLRLLAEFLDRTAGAGAAGNRLLNPDLTDQWSARRFPTWINAVFGRRTMLGRMFPGSFAVRDYLYKNEFQKGEPFVVDWVPGSCTLVRREVYRKSGGLPEGMHYWSDAVFCDRIKKMDWNIYIVPKAALVHYEGHGTGNKTGAIRRWLISDFHRGAYQFYCEHYALGRYSPTRWLAGVALEIRSWMLILADVIRHRIRAAHTERA
jgi:N-acetylglucosaminyl-diphospho-decaprenol L-rhamnosyltransferase